MHRTDKPPAIFLMGPTASGKTDLAIALSQQLPCEIISVDSALIYRGMDVGSAKPSPHELALAPHRLIDIRDPAQSYSAAEFRKDALVAMADISSRGKIPLLVGGTMLYFKTLLEGIADMPETEPGIRATISAEAEVHGWPFMHQQLASVDPDSAARIHPNHSQRIERALAVYRQSGITMTEYRRRQIQANKGGVISRFPYMPIQLAIAPLQRSVLHQRIEKRFIQMVEHGLIEEVRMLRHRADLHAELPSMRAVGYRQAWQYLAGELTKEEMVERGIIATRQLAKRQFTWLKGWSDLQWLLTEQHGLLVDDPLAAGDSFGFAGQPPVTLALKYIRRLIM